MLGSANDNASIPARDATKKGNELGGHRDRVDPSKCKQSRRAPFRAQPVGFNLGDGRVLRQVSRFFGMGPRAGLFEPAYVMR